MAALEVEGGFVEMDESLARELGIDEAGPEDLQGLE
jgi:hypothetical protein